MDTNEIFEAVNKMAAGAKPLGNTLLFKLDDHIIHLDGTGETNIVSQEEKEADCTISMAGEDFKALMAGDLNPMMAVMSGKIKIGGDMGVAMKLQSLF